MQIRIDCDAIDYSKTSVEEVLGDLDSFDESMTESVIRCATDRPDNTPHVHVDSYLVWNDVCLEDGLLRIETSSDVKIAVDAAALFRISRIAVDHLEEARRELEEQAAHFQTRIQNRFTHGQSEN